MQECCIEGCNGNKYNGTKNISYFKFPVHDETLLKKWLTQIGLPNWKPGAYHHICSMHFRETDFSSHPNRKQLGLKPTSIPTVFPRQHVEDVIPNRKRSPIILRNRRFQPPVKIVNPVSDTPVLQASPVILIPSQHPEQFSPQFPTKIAQNLNQTPVNNSMPLSTEYKKQIGAQHSPLHNSVQYVKQMKEQHSEISIQSSVQIPAQHPKQIDAQKPLQITMKNGVQITEQRPIQILVQTPTQCLKQVASQSSAEISEEHPKQVSTSIDPGQNREQQISESVALLLPISQPRLRKILPKPQPIDPNPVPTVSILKRCQSNSTMKSIPKPDILIVPKFEKSHPNGSGKVVFSRYPGNKRPVLRISINKEYNSKKTHCPSDKEERSGSRSDTAMHDATVKNVNSSTREMTIENSSTNKAVTFKLDPRTGEIIVTTRQLNDSTTDEAGSISPRTERKVDDTHPVATKLRQLYIQGQQECIALQRRLLALRQRHKQEQEEIEKLQEHLTGLGDEVQKTCSDDPSKSPCTKRKEPENNIQPNDFENLMREVKKIKHDIQRREDPSTAANGQSEVQASQPTPNCNNGASRFPEIQVHSQEVVDSSEGEIVGEIIDNCDVDVSKVQETPEDLNGDSASEDTVYRTEFLDDDFVIG